MKIALCGSAGVDKTALARGLSRALVCPLISNDVRNWGEEDYTAYIRDMERIDVLRIHEQVLAKKIEQENAVSNFIADSTTLDNVAYAIRWLDRERDLDEWLQAYYKTAVQHARDTYEIVFLLPFGSIPLEDDGIRSSSHWYQYEIQLMLESLLLRELGGYQLFVQINSLSLADRVEEAMGYIKSWSMEG
jgi:nicotinamide riboside kinase